MVELNLTNYEAFENVRCGRWSFSEFEEWLDNQTSQSFSNGQNSTGRKLFKTYRR